MSMFNSIKPSVNAHENKKIHAEIDELKEEIEFYKKDFAYDCTQEEIDLAKFLEKEFASVKLNSYEHCKSVVMRACIREQKFFNHFQFEAFCIMLNNKYRIKELKKLLKE